MLEVYVDESGTGGRGPNALLIMAGYVGESEKWREFSTRWQATLQKFGLPYFHMRHFQNMDHQLFKHLSRAQRNELIDTLISELKNVAVLGFMVYMRPADYRQVTDREFRNQWGSAYGMCMNLVILQLNEVLITPQKFPETVDVFLEDGHSDARGALQQLLDWKRLTDPAPDEIEGVPTEQSFPDPERTSLLRIRSARLASKKTMLPLHAADTLASLANATLHFRDDAFLDRIFNSLLASLPHISRSANREALAKAVAAAKRGDEVKASIRAANYEYKKTLRNLGLRIEQFPWGLTIDGQHLSDEDYEKILDKANAASRDHFERLRGLDSNGPQLFQGGRR